MLQEELSDTLALETFNLDISRSLDNAHIVFFFKITLESSIDFKDLSWFKLDLCDMVFLIS